MDRSAMGVDDGPLIVVTGDALVDLVPWSSDDQGLCFLPLCGGSSRNVAVGVARLGMASAFVGAVGSDEFGDMLLSDLLQNGVRTDCLQRVDSLTTIGFAMEGASGTEYRFYAKETADSQWVFDRTAHDVVRSADWLHVGSITLARGSAARDLEKMVYEARDSDRVVSFDPNVRISVCDDLPGYVDRILRVARSSSVVKISEEDLFVLGISEGMFVEQCLSGECLLVVVTRGSRGSVGFTRNGEVITQKVSSATVVDTVGAGDGYMAGIIVGAVGSGVTTRERLFNVEVDVLQRLLEFGSLIAGMTCARRGANPPTKAEVGGALSLDAS